MRLVLASGSPRRQELLAAMGYDFEVLLSSVVETDDSRLGMGGLCEENARRKAAEVARALDVNAIVIGADTLVFLDRLPLGKPKDLDEALEMLKRLRGRVHQVCTGVCICGPRNDQVQVFHEVTKVRFRAVADEVLEDYLSKTSPLDKAGAYGIQDYGGLIIEEIDGEYENVMGLPVKRLGAVLSEMRLPRV